MSIEDAIAEAVAAANATLPKSLGGTGPTQPRGPKATMTPEQIKQVTSMQEERLAEVLADAAKRFPKS